MISQKCIYLQHKKRPPKVVHFARFIYQTFIPIFYSTIKLEEPKKITASQGRVRRSLINSTLPIITDNPEDIKSHINTRLIINADDNNKSQILNIIKESGGNIFS